MKLNPFKVTYPTGAEPSPSKKAKSVNSSDRRSGESLESWSMRTYRESTQNDPPNPETPGKCARCGDSTFLDNAFCDRHMNGRGLR